VTILEGFEGYEGTTRNGVTTSDYGSWGGSYRVERADPAGRGPRPPEPARPKNALPDPGNLAGYRDKVGQSFLFEVTGATGGQVWGSDVYTDDSSLATAAVHAGVLRDGQKGVVKVMVLEGKSSYDSSTRHGVTTGSWGSWQGSFKVEPAGDEKK
jgi:hypothetical protein